MAESRWLTIDWDAAIREECERQGIGLEPDPDGPRLTIAMLDEIIDRVHTPCPAGWYHVNSPCPHVDQEVTTIDSWDEVPAFANEAEEAAYWSTHGPSETLLETFKPV